MVFEQNQGQAASEYRYLLHRDGMSVLFLPGGVDFRLPHKGARSSDVHLRLVGTQVSPAGFALQAGHTNYLLGSDASKWIRNVPQFAKVEYPKLYPGISLVFYGNDDSLEHDFVLQAGADPAQIAFRLSGAQAVELNAHGDLVVHLDAGNLLLRRPVAYQEAGNDRTHVNASFVLEKDGTIGFRLGRYDRAHPLVIDPVFTFSTYLAGTGLDRIAAVATDTSGNIYAVGTTSSNDFPTAAAEQPGSGGGNDVFVSKLDPSGHTLLYSTYLGGSGDDWGGAIAIDGNGNAIVTGSSNAFTTANFPAAGQLPSNGCSSGGSCYFLASFKPDGSALNYSGVINAGLAPYTNGNTGRVAVDAAGNAYLTGVVDNSTFPITAGTLSSKVPGYPYSSTFVMKISPAGKVLYSTVIPGNATPDPAQVYNNYFLPTGIAVDANGQATIAGTGGIGLPTTSGTIQPTFPNDPAAGHATAGFVLQLNGAASAINFASYLPGTDSAGGMAVDAAGNYYFAGATGETNLPVSSNAYQKTLLPSPGCLCTVGYVLKLNPKAVSVLAASYLGATPAGQNGPGATLLGIALDSSSNVFVGGDSTSADFPLQDPFITTYEYTGSIDDMVIAGLSPDLSRLTFGSFLSSTSTLESGSLFAGLTVDKNGKLIVAGITNASDFPTTDGSVEPKLPPPANPQSSPPHSFLSKIDLSIGAPSVCLSSESVGFGNVPAQTTGTQRLTLTNCGNAPLHLDSYVSSSPLVGATGNCSDVAAGAACTITVSYLPENSDSVYGNLTLSDNAAIPIQVVSFSGQGLAGKLVPRTTPLDFGHLLVGTTGPQTNLTLSNDGTADLAISAISVSGDYTISGNTCIATLTKGWYCNVTLIFAPSVSGARTGALVIHSNDPQSPQLTVPLTGVGDTQYATASITFIDPPALQVGVASQKLQVIGTNFYPASVVNIHGAPQTTTFVSNTSLTATLSAASLTGIGEVPVTVSTSAPGGGTSNAVTLTPYQALQLAASALLSVNGTLYASIPASSLTNPNTILPINPKTGKLGTPIPVGNDPQKMTASDDGKYIYVYVAGDGTIQRVNLQTSAVERRFTFPTLSWTSPQNVNDMHAVPGADQSLVVSFNGILALYDDTGLVSAIPKSYPGLDVPSFTFATDPATFYGLPLDFTSNAPEVYTLDSSGLHTTVPSGRTNGIDGTGGFAIVSDGTLLYTTDGSEWDAKTTKLLGKFTAPIFNQNSAPNAAAIAVDHGSGGRMYFLGVENYSDGSALILSSFNKQTFKNIGYLPFEGVYWPDSSNLTIWGTNGFAFMAPGIGLTDQEIYILSSSLNANPAQNPQPAIATISPAAAVAGGGAFTLTVNGTGFTSASTVTWNLTPRPATFVNDKQLTVAISAADIAEAGTAYVGVVNPAPGGGSSTLLNFNITPHAGQLSVSPGALDFGSQAVGGTSARQSVTVSNSGDQPVSIASISASEGFAETDACGGVLAPTATCTVDVTFTPATATAQTGTLTFADSAASTPQTVALSGTGIASGFTIGATSGGSTSATVTSGKTATYTLSLTGSAGTSGTVTLACTGAPAGATCTIAPATLNLVSGQASAFTVSVSTSGSSTSAQVARTSIAGLGLLSVLLPFCRKRRVRAVYLTVLLVSAGAGAGMLSGCGGSQSSTPPVASSSVAPGTYTLKIIATEGTVTAAQNLSLTVQ